MPNVIARCNTRDAQHGEGGMGAGDTSSAWLSLASLRDAGEGDWPVTGGIAALNHRLPSGIPGGMRGNGIGR